MKEYHYGQVHLSNVNSIISEWAAAGWEVQWCFRNKDTAVVDFLLVREPEKPKERYVDLGPM